MKWYAFEPSDTLFLRGAEPMVSGTSFETVRLFPPPVSVISGAVRTAVLAQQRVSISAYRKGDKVKDMIGEFGGDAPFKVVGPLLRWGREYFMPAPYTWHEEIPQQDGSGHGMEHHTPDEAGQSGMEHHTPDEAGQAGIEYHTPDEAGRSGMEYHTPDEAGQGYSRTESGKLITVLETRPLNAHLLEQLGIQSSSPIT
ncbi:MAG: hypothetical protein HQK66_06940, partial [Desulfamplus sp.]|nr:hypothetical protein [Desulfamplus sp.]